MTLLDLENAYKKISGKPYFSSFYDAHWRNDATIERHFENWISEKHPEFFSEMGSNFAEHERHLVNNHCINEIFDFLASLPSDIRTLAQNEILKISHLNLAQSITSVSELDSFQDYISYPYFDSVWKGFAKLENLFLNWIKENHSSFYKQSVKLFGQENIALMEQEIRNRKGAQVIVEFLNSVPKETAQKAVNLLRNSK